MLLIRQIYKKIFIGVLFFALIGCAKNAPNKAPAAVPNGAPTQAAELSAEDFAHIRMQVQKGEKLMYVPGEIIKNIPSEIFRGQVDIFPPAHLGDIVFLTAYEPKWLYSLDQIKFQGVLVSLDGGTSWKKFFTIKNPKDPLHKGEFIIFNVTGIFTRDKKIFVDSADERGAGSGEGNLIRFSSDDGGKTWKRNKCYYFAPEGYYLPKNIEDVKEITGINPDAVTSQEKIGGSQKNCVY